jgi:hypothetical protein
MNIIEKLKTSDIKSLQHKGADAEKWSALRHTKYDFELFLNFNIAEIQFKTLDNKDATIVCTSNTTLIKLFSTLKESDKKKIACLPSNGIKTKDLRSIDTWDLIDNKLKTVSLASWQINDFIGITPENILDLHNFINKLLKR